MTVQIETRNRRKWILWLAYAIAPIANWLPVRWHRTIARWLWARVRYEFRIAGGTWRRIEQPPLVWETDDA